MNRSERSRSRSPPRWHQMREPLAARAARLQVAAVAAVAAATAAVAAAAAAAAEAEAEDEEEEELMARRLEDYRLSRQRPDP